MPKTGDRRFTIEVLKSGQERAYADTVNRYRITFEVVPWGNPPPTEFQPWEYEEEKWVKPYAKFFGGWAEQGEGDWASTRLVYLKKVPDTVGVWEWETRATFTD